MKYVMTALALAALCVPAFAAGNPDVQIYISFDQTGAGAREHYYTMVPYTYFSAFVCVTGLDMGFTGVSFALTDVHTENPGMFQFAPVFSTPFEVQVGDVYTGISVATGTCRTEEVVVVGELGMFPVMEGDICIEIKDYPAFPRWVVDCHQPYGEVDFYCVFQNGTIGAGVCPVGDCPDPVEDTTWGGIKALYR
jgi:hypothetical protein